MTDNSNSTLFLGDLRKQLRARQVIVLVGTGVSISATERAPVASWTGLLMNGVDRCENLVQNLPNGWADRIRGEILSGDMGELLSAAEKVSERLKEQSGEYGRWLRETIGELRPRNPGVIEALLSLKAPILTTNYDTLIEEVCDRKWPSFSWRQPDQMERVLRGDQDGVLHLHGYWREPESVVMGIRSYDSILGAKHAQALLRAILPTKTLLFVGVGAGLEDLNFGALLEWARETLTDSQYRHFRLCVAAEVKTVDDPRTHIRALSYGSRHEDLQPFLEALVSDHHPEIERLAVDGSDTESRKVLTGTHAIQIWISQLFRIADLLIFPETVRAKGLLEIIHDPGKMRRALNRRWRFKLGELGSMKPVVSMSDPVESFWRAGIPELRRTIGRQLWFLPFDLSLTEYLSTRRYDPGSDLGRVLGHADSSISNKQISGRLRIYPPGVGVIRMGIALTFRESVDVTIVSQMVRGIEQLMFVDPQGQERPFEAILLEIVDQVAESLFLKTKVSHEERRWRPPEIVYSLHNNDAFQPEENLLALAKLMSLAPRNNQDRSELAERLGVSVASPHWQRDRTLVSVGEGVALVFVQNRDTSNKSKRDKLLDALTETGEVVAAGAYSEKALVEEIEKISALRLLDDSWRPENGDKFEFLSRLLQTIKMVLQAITSTKLDIQKRGTGILMSFAVDIWSFNNPVSRNDLRNGLEYIKEWLTALHAQTTDATVHELLQCIGEIYALSTPFKSRCLD